MVNKISQILKLKKLLTYSHPLQAYKLIDSCLKTTQVPICEEVSTAQPVNLQIRRVLIAYLLCTMIEFRNRETCLRSAMEKNLLTAITEHSIESCRNY